MSIPSTTIYVRPGWSSSTWTYAGASMPTVSGSSAVTAVSFSLDSSQGQQLGRGDFAYSSDGGKTWTTYALATDGAGTFVPAAVTLWRFADHVAADSVGAGTFTMHLKLADGSVADSSAAVVPDNYPVGVTVDTGVLFSTAHAGDAVALLSPIDTGDASGGRWVIDGQSQPGLFSVAVDAGGAGHLVVANAAAMPSVGQGVAVDVHYYDRYQLDEDGEPIAGEGVTGTLVFNVVDGATQGLAGFGPDLAVGAASPAAAPALATLSTGSFAAVWQGADSAIWAQLRGAAGNAAGAPFLVTSSADAAIESEPAVSALSGGGFVVAYSVDHDGVSNVAYRIVRPDGSVGQQFPAGAAGDAAMPSVATLADGSFVVGWRSEGQVHTLHAGASGAPIGSEQVFGALGTAYSPSIAALHGGDYAVAWGEIGDGNVYAALGSNPGAPLQVTWDGAAASISTAAPLAHVAALAGGGFVVAWDSYSNDPFGFTMSDIFFQRYDNAGNALGQVVQANIDSGAGHYDAAVAALPDGGFVVAWQAQAGDGDANGVFGRRFGADGSAVDAHEFQLNQQGQGDQASPALAALANGGFAAAWIDTQQGAAAIEARVLADPAAGQPVAHVSGTLEANVFTPGAGNHAIDGGDGLDKVVYQGAHDAFAVATGPAGVSVTAADGAVHDSLVNVERLQFSDLSLAFDIDGTAGEAYRLYQAAFDRTPDQVGLGYWIKALDRGASLNEVAGAFASSAEFADLYGANASTSQFVLALYHNTLHRAPDAAGFNFWVASIDQHGLARAEALTYFSESPENQAQVIGSIEHGIQFVPYG
jgi:hypothetical protein